MSHPPEREERRYRVQVNKRNLSNAMLSAGRTQALMEHEEQHHEEVPLQLDSPGPSDGFLRDTITSPGALGSHHGGHSKCSSDQATEQQQWLHQSQQCRGQHSKVQAHLKSKSLHVGFAYDFDAVCNLQAPGVQQRATSSQQWLALVC
jgi:hypothetical protein